MATNITAEFTGQGADGQSTTVTVVAISLADVTVNTTPTSTGGWNTASVTADLARSHTLTAANGVKPGLYEKCGLATFRRKD